MLIHAHVQSGFNHLVLLVALAMVLAFGAPSTSLAQQAAAPQPQAEWILAASWHPGFCKTRPEAPECKQLGRADKAATQFSLHGLWPVGKKTCKETKGGKWLDMPAVALPVALSLRLTDSMPGVASGLDRHEYASFGPCNGLNAEEYYAAALDLLDQLNGSPLRSLFVDRMGKTISAKEIRTALVGQPEALAGAVSLRCRTVGGERFVTGVGIALGAAVVKDRSQGLGALARVSTGKDCEEGIVAAAGP